MQSVSRANVRPRGPKSASRQPSGASGERKETVLHACPARSSEHGFISHRAQPFESQNLHGAHASQVLEGGTAGANAAMRPPDIFPPGKRNRFPLFSLFSLAPW
eukprot:1037427-Pleurochrysis_carterae.AAC.2